MNTTRCLCGEFYNPESSNFPTSHFLFILGSFPFLAFSFQGPLSPVSLTAARFPSFFPYILSIFPRAAYPSALKMETHFVPTRRHIPEDSIL
jgi:hypothetical protein